MKLLFRSMLVWLMLLALPFQGFASASMLLCAPMSPPAMLAQAATRVQADAGHDHAAMLAAGGSADAQHAVQDHSVHGQDPQDHQDHQDHDIGRCGTPAACCVGAALAPAMPDALPGLPSSSEAIPFHGAPQSSADLAAFERPPKSLAI
ncbi:hypothetical protein MJ904_18205 [Massilia sp. MB5]|uniref:hypothetical protein n=1 Tax=Massilia sp. MB5 TaxID=2919578 RepID=UPI001F0F09C0|nr:hypothetical protein [Massilia sp. MB5]UMR29020.1 hypothetical protein MJ904_18205 [Massilia sp. MB5]